MTSPLIATKLSVPRPRRGLVERPRLSDRLRRGAETKLTLISAPAGFGKTTLLTSWLAANASADRGVAWLSLDRTDNEPVAFWSHLTAALQGAAAAVGGVVAPVGQPGPSTQQAVLATLLNDLSALKKDIDVVLDDYHFIDDPQIEAGLAFLLDHLPAQVHLVISTRADPALPLARLRARGELVEVRSADLRFTADEAAAYLNDRMGLGLTPSSVAALEDRTEGWIAALQLAVLSLQGRDDAAAFIASFAGSDRYIVDYLVEEVLQRQPVEVRRFLSRTCILGRLSGPLCDAVTGPGGNGRAMLEALDRQNLFVIPLDDRRNWYRYHHLFADVLLTHLSEEERLELPSLHRRASAWLEANGERGAAIDHAFAGGDPERAAGLVERAIPELQRERREAVIRGWLRQLPNEIVRNRPVLGVGFAGALMSIGEFAEVEERLRDVERCLTVLAEGRGPDGPPLEIVVVDEGQLRRVPAAVELYRAALSQIRGDVAGTIGHAQRALEVAPPDDHLARAAASGLLGIAFWSGGNLEAAHRAWSDSRSGLQRAGHLSDTLGVSIAIADIQLTLGHLRGATQVFEQGLQMAGVQAGDVPRGTADMHTGLSELYRERNDLVAAHRHLEESRELGERAGLPQYPYRWRVAAAGLRRAEGDLAGAVELLDEAERLYAGDFFPDVRPVAALRAALLIAAERFDEAIRWQRDRAIGADDELSYLREYEHLVLARLLLATNAPAAALGLLDRLLEAAQRGGRNGSVIDILILIALASRQSDIEASLTALERALLLAAPEGYVRCFIDEGQPMAGLLKLAIKRRIAPDYARKLLASFGQPDDRPQDHPDLIEPLSERELDVLRLLRSELSGPDIARELMVSENTMRTHTKNIYDKLGVNSRRAAVRRAEELDLLARAKGH